MKNFRSGFTLVETLIAVVVIAVLATLAIGVVQGTIRAGDKKEIRQNLQTVWKTANMYFVENEKSEVALPDLKTAGTNGNALANLKPVSGEDYATVNGGKISATDAKLEITFGTNGEKQTIVYETK